MPGSCYTASHQITLRPVIPQGPEGWRTLRRWSVVLLLVCSLASCVRSSAKLSPVPGSVRGRLHGRGAGIYACLMPWNPYDQVRPGTALALKSPPAPRPQRWGTL